MQRNAPSITVHLLVTTRRTNVKRAINPLPKITPKELHTPDNMLTSPSIIQAGLKLVLSSIFEFSNIHRNSQMIIGNTRFETSALPCHVLMRKNVAGA